MDTTIRTDFKYFKEIEKKVHSALHENLTLLSAFYPPRKEFEKVLKKDMFVKNNKTAFYEVIYFLLNTLNPELTAQKLVSWPNLESEAKFRAEVIAYINVLNSLYENANIPICQTSSLITPGGLKFAKFMLKISQLVVREHLKKTDENFLSPIKPHESINLGVDKELNKVTKAIENETNTILESFNKYYAECVDKSLQMTERMEQLNEEIQKSKKTLEELNEQSTTPSLISLKDKFMELKGRINNVQELDNLFKSGEQLLKYLRGPAMTVEHHEKNFNVPEDVAHIITNKKEICLCEFFEAIRVLLETKALQLESPKDSCMQQTKEAVEIQSMRNQSLLRQLEVYKVHVCNMLDELKVSISTNS